ncbi:PadR family transcriptional regulator [Pseudonocardia acaciae]|uniref:PadR family transcriptional regulator n=1 Tax=Pseudonocardia acaciae TaxID=551276 RepID=UPI000567F6A6|nr:helix-turn-helix transcriptional regulator [Pseudonocardia acaciae]
MPPANPRPTRSPVGLAVLALLYEAPMHPYRLQKLISERGKDRVVNVRNRYSVQQALDRLARDGMVTAQGTERAGNYPQRTVYAITATGRDYLCEQLRLNLATPADEFPLFPAALSIMAIMEPAHVAALLRERRDILARAQDEETATYRRVADMLPPVFLIEDDYGNAMRQAEIDWLDRTLARIADGTLAWDPESLIAAARRAHDEESG